MGPWGPSQEKGRPARTERAQSGLRVLAANVRNGHLVWRPRIACMA